jgi:hypothetical protein
MSYLPQLGGISPYHPSLYQPYYLGEFDSEGNLLKMNDPLLYWLLPIRFKEGAAVDQKNYEDFMSKYAGFEFDWEKKE